MVPITINGEGPFHMVFDTGGSNMLMPEAVTRLGLSSKDAGFGGGAGDKQIPMQVTKVDTYKIGSIEMKNQEFLIMDLSHIKKAFGFKNLDGIIGYELLQKYVVTIDFDNEVLVFDSFEDFKPVGERIGFRLYAGKPVIPASLKGVQTEFLIDTGDRSSFTLFKKFSNTYNLSHYFSKNQVISGYGVGGPIPARLGKIPDIEFGKAQLELKEVPSRLPLTSSGFFAKSKLGGSVGNGILQDFVVSFNYRDQEMILRPGQKKKGPYKFIPPRNI